MCTQSDETNLVEFLSTNFESTKFLILFLLQWIYTTKINFVSKYLFFSFPPKNFTSFISLGIHVRKAHYPKSCRLEGIPLHIHYFQPCLTFFSFLFLLLPLIDLFNNRTKWMFESTLHIRQLLHMLKASPTLFLMVN
jgi:hypothetical protein